jgi:acyl carrier protein
MAAKGRRASSPILENVAEPPPARKSSLRALNVSTKDGRTMMDRESIRQTLAAYLEEDLGEPVASMDDEVAIREGMGLDSVDVVGLVMKVERQFRIRLASEELLEIVTIGNMLDLLQAKLAIQEEQVIPAKEAA